VSPRLYGIGAGPGDPELITVQGLRLLRAAEIVFLPATREGNSYAGSIVEEYLDRQKQRVIELFCPAYRDRALVVERWSELARHVASLLRPNRTGAFVCEGDPSLFSTFLHLRDALGRDSADINVRAIPGITSVSAAAAAAAFPLATWDERLLIAPATHDNATLDALFQVADSVALLKPGAALPMLIAALRQGRQGARAALVRRVGRPEQEIFTDPASMLQAQPDYFTTLLLRRTPS